MGHARCVELIQLAEKGDTVSVLAIVTLDEIAQEWCEVTAESMASGGAVDGDHDWGGGPRWWPISFAFNCLTFDLHRQFFLALVAFAPNDDVLGAIGAGPFEDWQHCTPGEAVWMQEQAARDPRFAIAFSNMR